MTTNNPWANPEFLKSLGVDATNPYLMERLRQAGINTSGLPGTTPSVFTPTDAVAQQNALFAEWQATEEGKKHYGAMEVSFKEFLNAKQNPAAQKSLEKTEALEVKINTISSEIQETNKNVLETNKKLDSFITAITSAQTAAAPQNGNNQKRG